MTEARYIGTISPILSDDWTDHVPTYYSHFDFYKKRVAAKKRLRRERGIFFTVCLLTVCLVMMCFTLNTQSRETYDDNARHVVEYGETLWSIAKLYKDEGENTRNFVYKIRKINNLESAAIMDGDVLIIPE